MSDATKVIVFAIVAGVMLAFLGLMAQSQIEANEQIAKIGVACVEKGGDWDTHRQTCKMP